jgi:hypothetical protein
VKPSAPCPELSQRFAYGVAPSTGVPLGVAGPHAAPRIDLAIIGGAGERRLHLAHELVDALDIDARLPPRKIRHAGHAQLAADRRVDDLALEVGDADLRRLAFVGDGSVRL